jgi:hypothetical protein
MTKENPKLHLELNPNRLAEIIGSAVFASTEVVNLHFNALSDENLNRPIEGSGVFYRFNGPQLNLDQRRAMHESWILGKAFQELLRSVRHALEEAHVMAALLAEEHKVRSNETLASFLKSFQGKAAGLSFPELFADVNKLLDPKLEFSDSYKSLQVARNCLEHRAGIVSNIETKGNPLRRVPTLVLDSGEALIESTAILDYLDELIGPERAMIAEHGPARRHALKVCALATGLGDKAVIRATRWLAMTRL